MGAAREAFNALCTAGQLLAVQLEQLPWTGGRSPYLDRTLTVMDIRFKRVATSVGVTLWQYDDMARILAPDWAGMVAIAAAYRAILQELEADLATTISNQFATLTVSANREGAARQTLEECSSDAEMTMAMHRRDIEALAMPHAAAIRLKCERTALAMDAWRQQADHVAADRAVQLALHETQVGALLTWRAAMAFEAALEAAGR